jgi:hypothetical protein
MAGLLVDTRDRIVNADHRRQPLLGVSVDREGVGQPAVGHQRVGEEQLPPRRVFRLILERAHGVLGDRVVRVTERIPAARKAGGELGHLAKLGHGIRGPAGHDVGLREHAVGLDVGGLRRHDFLQGLDGFLRFPEGQKAGAEEHTRRHEARVEREGTLERRQRLALVTSHRERHAEIHQEPRLVGERLQQIAIHPCSLVEPALLHGAGRGPAALGEIGGLGPRRHGYQERNKKKRVHQHHCPTVQSCRAETGRVTGAGSGKLEAGSWRLVQRPGQPAAAPVR